MARWKTAKVVSKITATGDAECQLRVTNWSEVPKKVHMQTTQESAYVVVLKCLC